MRKGMLPVCVVLAAGLMALACSRTTAPPPSGTTVVFKHGKLAGDERLFAEILSGFERSHPGLTIRHETLPASTDQQHQFYAINLESRSVPFDLFAVDVIWVQEFARAGWIQPVEHLAPHPERHGYFPSAVRAATFQGRLYAIPWYLDAGVLYYRRDLLERYGFQPPRTWPELATMTREILDREHDPRLKGFLWQGKQYEGLVCVALEFIWGAGGDLLDSDGQLEGHGAGRALRFMRSLIEDGVSPELVTTADEEATRHLFSAGRAIFMRNWPYAWSLLQQEGVPVRGKVGIAPLPAFPGHESVSVLGGWLLAIPSRAAHPKEAAELLTYLTSPAVQRQMALTLGYHPALSELYTDASLQQVRPYLTDLRQVLLAARPRPVTPYYLMLSQVWQGELSAVLVGTRSPELALASARRQADRILELDRGAVALIAQ